LSSGRLSIQRKPKDLNSICNSAEKELNRKEKGTIDSSYASRLLSDLIEIKSFTGEENDICEFMLQEMKSLGLKVKSIPLGDRRFSVVGVLGGAGGGSNLMLNGHLDTQTVVDGWTHDPFRADKEGDLIFGVGSSDQKAGVAAMTAAAKNLIDLKTPIKGDLIVAAVVAHMEGGAGTRKLVKDATIKADFGIVTEPTEMSLLVEGGGIVYLEITTQGYSVFTPQRKKGVSAILKMMKVISELEKHRFSYKPTRYIKTPWLNVGVISGGRWPSIVADKCTIQVDVRTLPSQTPAKVKKEIEGLLKKIGQQDPEFKASVEFLPTIITNPRNPWQVLNDHGLVSTLREAIRQASGKGASVGGFQGWADAGVLNEAGIPTVVYGPGDLEQIYAPNEHVRMTDVKTAARVYALSAEKLCNVDLGNH
jgi:acetylornithine deacetylase/succinyl-diaminopimelate desuccinylase family protein